jgi:hypothetical protein
MGSPVIPDELRPWVKRTAPEVVSGERGWDRVRWVAKQTGDTSLAAPPSIKTVSGGMLVSPKAARALLAYVDEIAAGLTGTAAMVLRSSPGLSLAQPELIGPGLVAEDDSGFAYFTPLGREVAAVLGGDR